jgi:hypothetical protein
MTRALIRYGGIKRAVLDLQIHLATGYEDWQVGDEMRDTAPHAGRAVPSHEIFLYYNDLS